MAQPEDVGCSDADCREEGVGASVVAGVDASPVFEAAEHDLDLVALAVQRPAMRDSDLAVGLGRDAGLDGALGQGISEPVAVIASVGD